MNTQLQVSVANIIFGFYCSVANNSNLYTVKNTITNTSKSFKTFADALNEMYRVRKQFKR